MVLMLDNPPYTTVVVDKPLRLPPEDNTSLTYPADFFDDWPQLDSLDLFMVIS
jgi:hypothetical protein